MTEQVYWRGIPLEKLLPGDFAQARQFAKERLDNLDAWCPPEIASRFCLDHATIESEAIRRVFPAYEGV